MFEIKNKINLSDEYKKQSDSGKIAILQDVTEFLSSFDCFSYHNYKIFSDFITQCKLKDKAPFYNKGILIAHQSKYRKEKKKQ